MSGCKQAGSFGVVKFHSTLWFHAPAVGLYEHTTETMGAL